MRDRRCPIRLVLALAACGAAAAPAPCSADSMDDPGPRGPGDLKTFFWGGRVSIGGAFPIGEARFGAPSGREFKPGMSVQGDLQVDIGSHVQLGAVAGIEPFSINAAAYGYNGSDGNTFYLLPRVHVYPYAFGFLRPYLGIGAGYEAAQLTRTVAQTGFCLFACGSTTVNVASYAGAVIHLATGVRYDVRIPGGPVVEGVAQPRFLLPLTAELAYNKSFWSSVQVMEPNGGSGPPATARPSYDQLLLTVGVGFMR